MSKLISTLILIVSSSLVVATEGNTWLSVNTTESYSLLNAGFTENFSAALGGFSFDKLVLKRNIQETASALPETETQLEQRDSVNATGWLFSFQVGEKNGFIKDHLINGVTRNQWNGLFTKSVMELSDYVDSDEALRKNFTPSSRTFGWALLCCALIGWIGGRRLQNRPQRAEENKNSKPSDTRSRQTAF
ncbi:MAG: hypothetical protein ACU84J_00815 [Gammaproteobacteria bacterium]